MINGYCDPRFEQVRQLLTDNVESGGEIGVSLYVNVEGEDVIDLWGGWRDRDHTARWDEHTVVNVFSGSKPITSLAMLMLIERGLLDIDATVAEFWPEFAQAGKANVLVRDLMGHTAGLPGWDPPFTYLDALNISESTARLAAQEPWWEPGTRGSYHASTFGHLMSELFFRASGEQLSEFIAREIAGPLNADFILGMNDSDFGRTATVYPSPEESGPSKPPRSENDDAGEPSEIDVLSLRTRAGSFGGTMGDPFTVFNSPDWRRTKFAGSSGHANGRGLGLIASVLSLGGESHGVRLLSSETIDLIFREQANGIDAYYKKPIRWGVGYALAPRYEKERGPLPFLRPGAKTAYWYGTGGSLALADVEKRVAIGYAMNRCQSGRNALNGVYYDAIYDILENS